LAQLSGSLYLHFWDRPGAKREVGVRDEDVQNNWNTTRPCRVSQGGPLPTLIMKAVYVLFCI
jgi:hypothetical protein